MPKPRFKIGDNVIYKTTREIGTINKVIEQKYSVAYKVTINGKVKTINEVFLEPYIDTEEKIFNDLIENNFGNAEDFKIFNRWIRLTRPLENNIYSYLSSKTVFNPHQFKPLFRFISPYSDQRLFIADEVGVGKTIETGIILKELLARNVISYSTPVLVACPASLLYKWKDEMKDKFQMDFYVHSSTSIISMLKHIKENTTVPQRYMFSIASLQAIRSEKFINILREIEEKITHPVFGLVIIDEAHHMRNIGTNSNELGRLLSRISEMMIMLSATPLNLRSEDLYNQMHILNPLLFPNKNVFNILFEPVKKLNRIRNYIHREFEDSKNYKGEIINILFELKDTPLSNGLFNNPEVGRFIERLSQPSLFTPEEVAKYDNLFAELSPLYYSFTRTRKREALLHQVKRVVRDIGVGLSPKEMVFHDEFLKTLIEYYGNRGYNEYTIRLIINTHRRIVASSIPASIKYIEWAIKERKIEYIDEEEERIKDVIIEDEKDIKTQEIDEFLVERFKALINLGKDMENIDTKYDVLRDILEKTIKEEGIDKIIVFSFFIRTLEYLKRRLEKDGFKVGVIHGDVPMRGTEDSPGRQEIIESFKKGDINILLSSEVGGEGLDFQFCHTIINYDLPYNPMRIEQRIGRVDRFGQKSDKIIVANFFIRGTVDEEIYERLYKRIRLIEDGVGILEPILSEKIYNLQNAILTGNLTEKEKEELQKQLEESIAKAKMEMEEFEKQKVILLSDDYLTKEITRLLGHALVTPFDALELTHIVVNSWPGCEFEPIEMNGSSFPGGVLVLSDEVVEDIKRFVYDPENIGSYEELKYLLKTSDTIKRFKVIFDGSKAISNPDFLFFSPTGFWVKYLLKKLENERKIQRVFALGVAKSKVDLSIGRYLVFMFEIRVEGIRNEINILGIPYSISEKNIKNTDFFSLPFLINTGRDIEVKDFEIGDITQIQENIYQFMEEFIANRYEEFSEKNNYIVDSRIEALKRASEMRISRIQKNIENYISSKEILEDGKKYIRLMKAKIERERERLNMKIKELEKKKNLSIDYSLEGIILLGVI